MLDDAMTPHDLLQLLVADALVGSAARARVFVERGMACVGCPMARFETVAEAAAAYHLDPSSLATALLAASSEPAADGTGR
jgi:hybrid cluster-associated redox disulfide protein